MIKKLLKGIVMGIANIIPGVSGGTMAVSMGIYDRLIHCLTHLFKEFKESMKFLIPIFLGIGIALVGLSFIIEPAFAYFPLQTNCLFIGLIVGGLPAVWQKVKGKGIKISYIVPFVLFFAVVVGMAAIGEKEGTAADLSFSVWSVIRLFAVGIIASATMVIPGVSGSMMMLLMGYYNPIVAAIKNFVTALAAFDMAGILEGCGILVPMGLGIVVGIFAIAKVIEIIFEKFPIQAFWAIIGLIVASPIAIFLLGDVGAITVIGILTSIVTFAVGFLVAVKLGD
jgi:putative membrane protein